jgi:glycopeptide antibiotics resistance protein
MRAPVHSTLPLSTRGVFRWLWLFYSLFIIYGCFIPFQFEADSDLIRWRLGTFLTVSMYPELWKYSITDGVSNVLLFAPFGFFCIAAEIGKPRRHLRSAALLFGGFIGAAFALAIELAQTLTPSRTPSMLDVLCNGTGSAIGACAGFILCRELGSALEPALRRVVHERPSLFLLILFLLAPAVSAYYPFDVTLDVSTVWENVKRMQWMPLKSGFHRFWLDLLIEKVLTFAAIGYIVKGEYERTAHAHAAAFSWLITTAFALTIETTKIFFVGRTFNADNLMWASLGAALGVVVVPLLARIGAIQRRANAILLLLAIALLAYFELEPFDWISAGELPGKLSRIEWLVFSAYYLAQAQAAFFDLITKLYLSVPVGFLLLTQMQTSELHLAKRKARVAGALLGLCLEAAQLALRSRTPSVTDVLIIGFGCWLGTLAFERYQSFKLLNHSLPNVPVDSNLTRAILRRHF